MCFIVNLAYNGKRMADLHLLQSICCSCKLDSKVVVLMVDDQRVCWLQFGKVDAHTYIMDFNPNIVSAAQAFAVALSTFDTKVLL